MAQMNDLKSASGFIDSTVSRHISLLVFNKTKNIDYHRPYPLTIKQGNC